MICVGIDVAKDKHDCFIISSEGEALSSLCRSNILYITHFIYIIWFTERQGNKLIIRYFH